MKLKMKKISFACLVLFMLLLMVGCSKSNPIGEYQSVKDLYKECPGDCGEVLACEGQQVKVWGYLDAQNIFEGTQNNESTRFLIAEKLDAKGFGDGKVIEVLLPQNKDLSDLFRQLYDAPIPQQVFVTGTVGSFDAPMNLICRKMMTITIDDVRQVSFEK